MRAKLKSVKAEMRRRMHHPIPVQGRWLASVLQGHYNSTRCPTTAHALRAFRERVKRHCSKRLGAEAKKTT